MSEKHHRERDRDRRLEAMGARPAFCGPIDPPEAHDTTEHLALLYETPSQQFATVGSFIKDGLERGERCLCILDETERDDLLDAMRDVDIDVAEAIEGESLLIRSIEETYRADGSFDPDEVLAFYADAIDDAVAECEALRVAAETAWIVTEDPPIEEVMEYEARVNELLANAEAMALCQYERDRFPEAVLRDVLRTHPHVVFDGTIARNFYYVPPARFLNGKRTACWSPDRRLQLLLETTERTIGRRNHAEFLRDLHTAITRSDRPFEERLRTVFDLGCDRFDLELGVLARIDADTGRLTVEYTNADHDYFSPGATLPLSEPDSTASVATDSEVPGIVTSAESGVTVYSAFGPQVPLGTTVDVSSGDDRAFFFLHTRSEREPVSAAERRFHEWIGHWVKAELDGQRRAARLEERNRRYRLGFEVLQSCIEAPTRSRVEQTICDRLVAAGPYEAAWISTRSLTDQPPTPRVWAGIPEELAHAETADETWTKLSRRARRTERPETAQLEADDPPAGSIGRHLRERGIESILATPLLYEDTCYGVLVVCADRANAFTDHHRTVLGEIGTLAGFTIAAVERKALLVTDEIVELEVRVRDSDHFFFAATDATEVVFSLEGVIPRSAGSYLVYVRATGEPVERVFERADRSPDVERVRLVDRQDDDALFEFVFAGPTVVETFAEYGGTVTAATAEDGDGIVTVEFPPSVDVRSVIDAFRTTFPDSTVVAKRTRDRPATTDRAFRRSFTEHLTEKQREVVRAAYFSGYFDRPRRTTGDELAATLDISSSTLHQHLQAGLRKLLAVAFEDRNSE